MSGHRVESLKAVTWRLTIKMYNNDKNSIQISAAKEVVSVNYESSETVCTELRLTSSNY